MTRRANFYGSSSITSILGLCFSVLVGCSGARSPAPNESAVKQTEPPIIRVACPDQAAAAVIGRYTALWASQTGTKVEIITGTKSTAGGVPDADVLVIRPAELSEWAALGKLEEVPSLYRASDGAYAWRNLLAPYRDRLLEWNGKAYAFPILGSATVCFYRSDVLADPATHEQIRKRTGRDISAPATWEDFATLAEVLRAHTGKPSLPPLPADDEALDAEFFCIAAPLARRAHSKETAHTSDPEWQRQFFSFHYDLRDGQPLIATTGFVEALRILQRLQSCRAPGAGDSTEAFRSGQALLCIADASLAGRLQESDSAVRNKWAVSAVPGSARFFEFGSGKEQRTSEPNRVPYLGGKGWIAGVRRDSPAAQTAFAMLANLTGPESSKEIMLDPAWGADVYRREQLDYRGGWQALELRAQATALVDALRMTFESPIINPVYRLRTPDQRVHEQALLSELRAALAEPAKDPHAIMAAVAKRWQEIDNATPRRDRLRAYRVSLGLRGD